jgi:hypothetical protein
MKNVLAALLLLLSLTALARGERDLINQQKKQEKIIRSALRRNQITRIEFDKLMREQKSIIRAIELADLDGVWSSRELNYVKGKLDRGEKRLIRYKNNSEVY